MTSGLLARTGLTITSFVLPVGTLGRVLARGLDSKHLPGIQKSESLTPLDYKSIISGRSGIIYFENYWERASDNRGRPSGDHIDLWNGSRISDWSSWIRIQMGIVVPGVWSDFEQSQRVLFWRVME